AKAAYPDRYVVFAQNKTSPDGKGAKIPGVYMSCLLRPSIFPSQATFLSSLATVAAITALEEHTTKQLGIGWVSTVYCDGKIIGDVSIEGKLDSYTSYEYIIVNFSFELNSKDFPPRLTDIIKKVFERDNNSIPMIIGKNIISKFFALYANMKNTAKFMDIYKKKFILRGKYVKEELDNKKTKYKVLGIDTKDCSLLVEDPDGNVTNLSSPKSVTLPKRVKIQKQL
ncbi:MAG: hypothetical protein IJW38_04610, partial [Clostridia bacterium]|nr:hypothetical protein [Clostridia bacterium]